MTASRDLIRSIVPYLDWLLAPVLIPSGFIMRCVRRIGIHKLPLCRSVLNYIGVFPIMNHYYEPRFDVRGLKLSDEPRNLPGIDLNLEEQLQLLDEFHFQDELRQIPVNKPIDRRYYYNNGRFGAGDAEFIYSLIRLKKPRRIIEVGSGNSTLMILEAIEKNRNEIPAIDCKLTCIEPYERPWLEQTGVEILRKLVEDVDRTIFAMLEQDDILFIDSSHMIRPEGDVLVEFLELLPSLKPGVIVHVHDIYTPRDYPKHWIAGEVKFWNEQYLLEAFLSDNRRWKVIGSVNHLFHDYFDQLKSKFPMLERNSHPGSFYLQKTTAQNR
jgi:predicted O-methyltransferase YrrM